jgi:hypothetical protein
MRIGRAHHEVRGHGSSTGPKGAANVDHSVGDSALANGNGVFEERPTRQTHRNLSLDYVGRVSRTDTCDGRRRHCRRHR